MPYLGKMRSTTPLLVIIPGWRSPLPDTDWPLSKRPLVAPFEPPFTSELITAAVVLRLPFGGDMSLRMSAFTASCFTLTQPSGWSWKMAECRLKNWMRSSRVKPTTLLTFVFTYLICYSFLLPVL